MNTVPSFRVSAIRAVLSLAGVAALLMACGPESGVVEPDAILPQFAKPDCDVDPSHPSCGGSGPDPSGTLDAAGGMAFSDAPAIVESDNGSQLNAFVDGDVSIHYGLAATGAAISSGTCTVLHGSRLSDAEAQAIANTLAAEIDDDTQTANRFVAGADWSEGSGGINTGYASPLGPIRVRVTDASNFPHNGAPSASVLFDDGTTTVIEYTGGTLLVWLNLKKQDAVQVGCPNAETVRVTLTR